MQHFAAQKANGGKLVVADPRPSITAEWATIHPAARPGSDAALANGLPHVLHPRRPDRRALHRGIHRGFDDVRAVMPAYDPHALRS